MISFLIEHADLIRRGFIVSFQAANLSFVFALIVGVLIASFRVSPVPPLRRFATVYVALFRNTPLLVVYFLFYFGLPKLGFTYSSLATTVMVMALYTGAYLGEAVRSGVNAVATGQAEAARAIGLNFGQLLTLIVIPQALRTVVAPIGNLYIANAKNTALGLTIGLTDLTAVAQRLVNRTASIYSFVVIALLYMIWLLIAGYLFGVLERRVAIHR